ncbi:sensor histidine kinase [Actinomadura sp. HBU206391]|uniref:sensor histidine kinase n=1 Tax=Actinomadura sp. HBU206391 TaxID=2731692 RepID=UPI00164F8829|nr:histidine kinase [Actinomadura sp. HBU206391]MBC6460606.1 sensor histidine kinase [Actinomadura sp. HBU206391]
MLVDRVRRRWTEITARLRQGNTYVVDTAVAAAVAVAVMVQFLNAPPGGVTKLGILLNAGTVVPLIWRRRMLATVAITILISGILVSMHHRPGQMLQYGGLVVIYTIADMGRVWQRRAVLAVIVIAIPPGAWLKGNTAPEFMFSLLLPLTAYLLASLARTSRARTTALEERAAQLERERQADAARAAVAERARIARDMHDVLAHAVSIMVVQAEAGPVVVRSDPAQAEQTFDAIAGAGRDAMLQLRRMLGVLKEEQDIGVREPQPTVASIAELVAQVEHTNLRVDLRVDGEPRPLPPDVEVAAYRIVQEALTNTVKHAAARSAAVRLEWSRDELVVTVTDDGRGTGGASDLAQSGGHGLIGIRERAAACGGAAEAGPAPGGGFQVTARLRYAGPDRHAPPRAQTGRAA